MSDVDAHSNSYIDRYREKTSDTRVDRYICSDQYRIGLQFILKIEFYTDHRKDMPLDSFNCEDLADPKI